VESTTTRRPRLLLVCGSLQLQSTNRAALAAAAASVDAQVTWAEVLGALPPFDPDIAEQPHAAVDEWRRQVAGADGVLLAVPEYAGGMAGALKNALDWLVGTGELYRRPVAVLSAGTTGGVNARRQAAQTLTWQGAYVVAEHGIAAPRTKFADDGRITDEATSAAVTGLARELMEATGSAATRLVERATAVVARLGVDTGHVTPA
jgi:chromate reductase